MIHFSWLLQVLALLFTVLLLLLLLLFFVIPAAAVIVEQHHKKFSSFGGLQSVNDYFWEGPTLPLLFRKFLVYTTGLALHEVWGSQLVRATGIRSQRMSNLVGLSASNLPLGTSALSPL